MIIEYDDHRVTLSDTPAVKDEVYYRIVTFLQQYDCWSGESFMQRDEPQSAFMDIFTDIIDDTIRPNVIYYDGN